MDYRCFLDQGFSSESAYEQMVKRNPYRVLSDANYDWDEDPINDENSTSSALFTDVISSFIGKDKNVHFIEYFLSL